MQDGVLFIWNLFSFIQLWQKLNVIDLVFCSLRSNESTDVRKNPGEECGGRKKEELFKSLKTWTTRWINFFQINAEKMWIYLCEYVQNLEYANILREFIGSTTTLSKVHLSVIFSNVSGTTKHYLLYSSSPLILKPLPGHFLWKERWQ